MSQPRGKVLQHRPAPHAYGRTRQTGPKDRNIVTRHLNTNIRMLQKSKHADAESVDVPGYRKTAYGLFLFPGRFNAHGALNIKQALAQQITFVLEGKRA